MSSDVIKYVATGVLSIAECIADLGVSIGKEHFKSKVDVHKLHNSLMLYIEKQREYNNMCSLAEEIDFQGLIEYIDNNLLTDVSSRVFSTKKEERTRARYNIIEKAISYSDANKDEARRKIARIVSNTLDIIREFYKNKISMKEYIMAAEIVDAVTEEINNVQKNVINVISDSAYNIQNKIEAKSEFSLDEFYLKGKRGDFRGIEDNLKAIAETVSHSHPLYPDYGFIITENHLESLALTPTAVKKYPPHILVNGVAKMDRTVLSNVDKKTIDYANRHQLQITLDIVEAKQLLGMVEDPDQTEARQMIGKRIVFPPKEFPPAFPCNIKIGNEVFFEYIELRIAVILDDGTYVVNNKEQKDCNFLIELRFSFSDPQKRVYYKMNTENATNRELLKFNQMMKQASAGDRITIYALKAGKDFMSGDIGAFDFKTDFKSLEEEINFLQDICEIEEYIGRPIKIPNQIYEMDVWHVNYITDLIKGNQVEFEWNEKIFSTRISDHFRKAIINIGEEYHALIVEGTIAIKLFEDTVELNIVRKYRCAKIKNIERFKKKVEYSDDGENIQITFIAGEDNTAIDYLPSIS